MEAVSSKFGTAKPYFNTGMFIDLDKIDDLGFPHLREYLEKYMCWLGINQEYNVNVLRVFCQSLTAEAKYKKMNGKDQIRRVTFTATVRGRTLNFTWRDINRLMGVTEGAMNEWLFPEKLSQVELEKVYDTKGKKVSGMSDFNRLLYYVYSRMMTHKGGNFNEFTLLDNPWFPRFLSQQPINPGQLISLELHRWIENQKSGSLPYPTVIAFLLEKYLIKSTSTKEAENVKCAPVSAVKIHQADKGHSLRITG